MMIARVLLLFLPTFYAMRKTDIGGSCPYCDPNYMDVPNLQSAMKGYDVPMGDPNSKHYP